MPYPEITFETLGGVYKWDGVGLLRMSTNTVPASTHYSFTTDSSGHITAYGDTETIPTYTASDCCEGNDGGSSSDVEISSNPCNWLTNTPDGLLVTPHIIAGDNIILDGCNPMTISATIPPAPESCVSVLDQTDMLDFSGCGSESNPLVVDFRAGVTLADLLATTLYADGDGITVDNTNYLISQADILSNSYIVANPFSAGKLSILYDTKGRVTSVNTTTVNQTFNLQMTDTDASDESQVTTRTMTVKLYTNGNYVIDSISEGTSTPITP